MTTHRALPLANLVGCCVITSVIFVQWFKERGLNEKIQGLNGRVALENGKYEAERKRALLLESDVIQLKESIESMVITRKETEETLDRMIVERANLLSSTDAAVTAANQSSLEQVKTWQDAIAARDKKIRELDASLSATRTRLNEAIERLKAAGAR